MVLLGNGELRSENYLIMKCAKVHRIYLQPYFPKYILVFAGTDAFDTEVYTNLHSLSTLTADQDTSLPLVFVLLYQKFENPAADKNGIELSVSTVSLTVECGVFLCWYCLARQIYEFKCTAQSPCFE